MTANDVNVVARTAPSAGAVRDFPERKDGVAGRSFLEMRQKTGPTLDIRDCASASDRSSLRRFRASAPRLRELLRSRGGCERELLLQAAMRDTLRRLAAESRRAARIEADPVRAERLRLVSEVATELALTAHQ
ncbi:MAG TPA: hypothetical protein VF698_02730 [Thermoanaerobaculia bacterium]